METKRVLENWRMPKLQESFTENSLLPSCVNATEGLAVLQYFRHYDYFEQVKMFKNVS